MLSSATFVAWSRSVYRSVSPGAAVPAGFVLRVRFATVFS
jgi:hypothetical protein